jgi:endoplasmic reticulum Man8GlcNAc2 1,2-alpha-mannosidase
MNAGKKAIYSLYMSSLGAFWPALQVLSGHVLEAERTFARYEQLWNVFHALPDIYDMRSNGLLGYGRDYPLRPEMVSSIKLNTYQRAQLKYWSNTKTSQRNIAILSL